MSTAQNSRFEVRGGSELEVCSSIQSLGAAEEGVDAKFEVKRAEIQRRRIPKCPRESPPEWKSKAATSAATSRLNLESNLGLEISPLQSSLSRIRRALDDAAIYRRRTPSLMRSILSIAAYSVLSKIDDADRGRNARGMTVGFRARCSRIPSVSKARRRRRQDGMRMERESSDIKSRGGGEGKWKPSTVCRLCPSSSSSG